MNKLSFSTLMCVRTSRIVFIFCCLLMTTFEMKAMVASNYATPTPFSIASKATNPSSELNKREGKNSFLRWILHRKAKSKIGKMTNYDATILLLLLAGLFFSTLLLSSILCLKSFSTVVICNGSGVLIGLLILVLFLTILGIRKVVRKKKRAS